MFIYTHLFYVLSVHCRCFTTVVTGICLQNDVLNCYSDLNMQSYSHQMSPMLSSKSRHCNSYFRFLYWLGLHLPLPPSCSILWILFMFMHVPTHMFITHYELFIVSQPKMAQGNT
jgi:hypothetical protein